MLEQDRASMHTVHGIRFMPVLRIDGTLLGFDARWVRARSVALVLILALVTPAGPLSQDSEVPLPVRIAVGLSTVLALVVTSLGHELGHALAGRLAGLNVRAIVLGPNGGLTIRASSEHPHVNFRTALAGPLANGVFAAGFAALAWLFVPDTFAWGYLNQVGVMQLLTALANLLPFGAMDGTNILAAWRSLRGTA